MRDVAVLATRFQDFVEFINRLGLSTFGCKEVPSAERGFRYCLVQNMTDAQRRHFHSKIELETCWDRALWNEVEKRIEFSRELREGKRWD